jgi:hypothetical protein
MEKLIARWNYWLGIACLVIAVTWRAVNAFGLILPLTVVPGHTIWYLSFFRGSILFSGRDYGSLQRRERCARLYS